MHKSEHKKPYLSQLELQHRAQNREAVCCWKVNVFATVKTQDKQQLCGISARTESTKACAIKKQSFSSMNYDTASKAPLLITNTTTAKTLQTNTKRGSLFAFTDNSNNTSYKLQKLQGPSCYGNETKTILSSSDNNTPRNKSETGQRQTNTDDKSRMG